MQEKFDKALYQDLLPQLQESGFSLLTSENLDQIGKEFCKQYFDKHLKGNLKSKSKFNSDDDRLFIKSGQAYLLGMNIDGIIIYELPTDQPRFVEYKKNTFVSVSYTHLTLPTKA